MSLTVSVDFAFSATKVILQDNTGAYDVSSNPTGYGAPNPLFSDYAHYAIIRKKYAGVTPDAVLTMDSYNPLTATDYPATRAIDGWYEGTKLNILKWTAGSYAADTVRYYGGVVYKAKLTTSALPTVASDWDVVSDLTTVEANSTVIATIVGRVTVYNADAYWSQWCADIAADNAIGINIDDPQEKRFYSIWKNIKLALAADQLGDNLAGEAIVNRLQNLGAR